MLKLKKLQILGFKSFCDRTEMKFHGEGIAAIVGPNGCGKSNIADAISWVLGEQSAKTLRGSRMEDVIFVGTRDRKPTGMAEVSLTLIDPQTYEGGSALLDAEPEIEILDDVLDDWDEAASRLQSAGETEQTVQEVQPLAAEGTSSESATAAETGPTELASGNPVVLKIRRRKLKTQQLKTGEIMVTRRLFRSGESEYLLNGKICRLRDIQDLFMGTGLGPESYAIIEQGRIGQILSSKPHDRRAIIEEAAGVSKFKTRKRLAESRLEQSNINLARIDDIFEEVTRQMNSLKRQASKAERYARLREEMRQKLRIVLAGKFTQLEKDVARVSGQLHQVGDELRLQGETVQQIEEKHAAGTDRAYALDQELRLNSEQLGAAVRETDRLVTRRQHNEERCAELKARTVAAQAEFARVTEQFNNLETELAENRRVVDTASTRVAAAQAEAERSRQHSSQATATLSALETQQEERRSEILAQVAALSEARNRLAKAEEQAASLQREWDRSQQERATTTTQMESFGGRRGQSAFEFESVTNALTQLQKQIAEAREELAAKKSSEGESKIRLDGLRTEYASALGKRKSLESLIAEHGFSSDSVKRLCRSGGEQKGFAHAGVLADFLEVDARYENVVEDFLRDELNYIVVKSWDAADEGLRMLRTGVDGRATFLVHPDDAQARFSFAASEETRFTPNRKYKSIVPLKEYIRVLNGFGKSLEVILPKLGHGYIAPDSFMARDMALENPNAFFLAPNGETFHNVTVTGGKQPVEGPLSMKRELRELMTFLSAREQSLRNEEASVALLGREIASLEKLLLSLESEQREVERKALTSEHELQHLESEIARLQLRLAAFDAEAVRIRTEHEAVRAASTQDSREAAVHEAMRQRLEAEFTSAQTEVADWKLQRENAMAALAQVTAHVAALEERRIASSSALERIETLARETQGRRLSLQGEMEADTAESRQRFAENAAMGQQLATLEAERAETTQRAAQLQTESEQLRQTMHTFEQNLRELRQELDALRDRRGDLSAQAAKLQSDAEYLAESCRNELGVTREELFSDPALLRLEGEALTQEDVLQHELRARLEAMGPVNMMALEEYNETAQRHAFLEGQRKDLVASIENTLATIKELDDLSRQKFDQAFAQINENFQFTFRKLFGGGQAFMRLTDIENSNESGIDVIASPPGKKLQNVLLLSGGEKALTALALLVGIFQYQPSPFCVLDEVDAPLDEANVGRFTEMVKELSMQTQFVIITHNKRTMSVAPVLYGVTMQEPGVSKIVSVRFGEGVRATA